MIKFTRGNIFDSDAQALINTVNCEGYMGKGIAYQFKLKFPENNKEYVNWCKTGKLNIGKILPYWEKNKLIINFPTKDKWRDNSEYSYIENGLISFSKLIPDLNVQSFAIPALGCGNGGLDWAKVKELMLNYLEPISNNYQFIIYEPIYSENHNLKKIPNIGVSHLILMNIKQNLSKFNSIRLQVAAYLMNIFAGEELFKFKFQNNAPYSHNIELLSKNIKEYQEYFKISTEIAIIETLKRINSKRVKLKTEKFEFPIIQATTLVNEIQNDEELIVLSSILCTISKLGTIDVQNLYKDYRLHTNNGSDIQIDDSISTNIKFLINKGVLIDSLLGVSMNSNFPLNKRS